MSELLSVASIAADPADYVRQQGDVLVTFDRTQDSGNVSWLVEADGRRLFVKTAGRDGPPAPGAPVPYFDHAGRVRLLRNAVELARSCEHPALARLLNVIESPAGPLLVYAVAAGEVVHVPRSQRSDPARRTSGLPSSRPHNYSASSTP